ncbi:MAG: LPS export ABC transporter permease LptG [Alphaproteobacteria bacterium]|jgi:lipopolysaccharide export system permease protein|nr:LPS export ABC transporter permease LptG [Alphaproteobacteria bacterium]
MRLSMTLSAYIGRQFFFWCGGIFLSLTSIIFMLDLVELMRRASSKQQATLDIIAQMALLKIPLMAQEIIPFVVLFGGMLVFSRLTRAHELVVARAAGVSVWQFLLPALVIAFLIGCFSVMVFNPFASITTSRFEHLESRYLRGKSSLLAVSSTGLWLRQSDKNGQSIIHAQRVLSEGFQLQDVIIFLLEDEDKFAGRIDASTATLDNGNWQLANAWITAPNTPPRFKTDYRVKTELTFEKIQESFASPETMSFWNLPDFIKVMENAGFSALRHRLHWYTLLALPFLLCAMVLIAATFSLRLVRHGGTALIVAGGIFVGFFFYLFSDLVYALGLSSSLPVMLAAWSPVGISVLLGLAMLMHLEDG